MTNPKPVMAHAVFGDIERIAGSYEVMAIREGKASKRTTQFLTDLSAATLPDDRKVDLRVRLIDMLERKSKRGPQAAKETVVYQAALDVLLGEGQP